MEIDMSIQMTNLDHTKYLVHVSYYAATLLRPVENWKKKTIHVGRMACWRQRQRAG
jgi:hypothetical protein